MGCPYYNDFTRDCIREYPAIIEHKDFTDCETDGYHHCLIYTIMKNDFHCPHLNACLSMFPTDIPDFYHLMNQNKTIYTYVTKPIFQYCLSQDNHQHCARYQLKQNGHEPPPGLSPEGRLVDINHSTDQQKIVFEKNK